MRILSIVGLRKRNLRNRAVYNFNERDLIWELQSDSSETGDVVASANHLINRKVSESSQIPQSI